MRISSGSAAARIPFLSSGTMDVYPEGSMGMVLLSCGGSESAGTDILSAHATPSAMRSLSPRLPSSADESCFFRSMSVRTSMPAFLAFSSTSMAAFRPFSVRVYANLRTFPP